MVQRFESSASPLWEPGRGPMAEVFHEPPVVTLARFDRHRPRQPLAAIAAELRRLRPDLGEGGAVAPDPVEESLAWARREQARASSSSSSASPEQRAQHKNIDGPFIAEFAEEEDISTHLHASKHFAARLALDELAAVRLLCTSAKPDFFAATNSFLFGFEPGKAATVESSLWEDFVGDAVAGLVKLPRVGDASCSDSRRSTPLSCSFSSTSQGPIHFEIMTARGDRAGGVCEQESPGDCPASFADLPLASVPEAPSRKNSSAERVRRLSRSTWVPLQTWKDHFDGKIGAEVCFVGVQSVSTQESWHFLDHPIADSVPCLLEFDEIVAGEAVDVSLVGASDDERFLLPHLRVIIRSIQVEQIPDPTMSDDEKPLVHVFRVKLGAVRTVQPLASVLTSPAESTLAGALLVGLHGSGTLLTASTCCFEALAGAAQVRCMEAVETMWKSYWKVVLDDLQSVQRFNKAVSQDNGLAVTAFCDVALVALRDVAHAFRGLTRRVWGCADCIDHTAMEEEQARRSQHTEELKREAVAVVRERVVALELETLSDPDSFLSFIQHDPMKAFEAVPAVAKAYVATGPEQRVLLFAKLMGLVAMAGGLLKGEEKVQAAFDSPLPLAEDPWQTMLGMRSEPSSMEEAARNVSGFLQLQRLQLARTRLLVAGGAPDVGKTTFVKEVFGFKHLTAGLSKSGRTEQLTFELHPEGDERLRPVYIVDTPGFGDGEQLYRNDMGRLLMGAGSWIPGGVTLLWVVRAGRNVRHEADELLRKMVAADVKILICVTHVDRLFEERYREVGPLWRDGLLQNVGAKDPRWREQRQVLMTELQGEISNGLRTVTGKDDNCYQTVYACLGGWMMSDWADEFAQAPPWPWARQELRDFFGILSASELRDWLDDKVGL